MKETKITKEATKINRHLSKKIVTIGAKDYWQDDHDEQVYIHQVCAPSSKRETIFMPLHDLDDSALRWNESWQSYKR